MAEGVLECGHRLQQFGVNKRRECCRRGDTGQQVGLLLLLWLPQVRVPDRLARLAGTLAGASLWTYLTHWQVYPHLEHEVPLLAVLLSLAVGVVAHRVAGRATSRLAGLGGVFRERVEPRAEASGGAQGRRAASGGAASATSPASSTGRAPGIPLTATGVPTG